MKKVLTILALVLVMAIGATAQDPAKGMTGAGIKAGVALANLTGDISGTSMKTGFGFGGFLTFGLSETFSIQPELLYIMKGAKEDVSGGTVKLKLNYLQVPVLFKYDFPTQSSFKPSIFVGPAVGILMSAKVSAESGGAGVEVDVKDLFNSADLGLVFGLGAEIATGSKGGVTFDARYDLGLSNIAKDSGDQSVKNATIGLFIGYSFL